MAIAQRCCDLWLKAAYSAVKKTPGMLGLLGVLMLAAISNAPVEFCPAAITIRAQGVKHSYQDQLPRSAQYGFELSAEGSRVVTSSKVAFETDAGWFTIDVPPVALTERFWHYGRPYDRVIDREFVSPVMYAKFPAPVRVLRVWVSSAAASGDNTFGWSGKGTVQCEPPPVRDVHAFDPSMDVVDFDDLGAEPPAGALQLTPQSSPALASANCRNPFEDIKSIERLLPDGTANTNHSRDAKDVLLELR